MKWGVLVYIVVLVVTLVIDKFSDSKKGKGVDGRNQQKENRVSRV